MLPVKSLSHARRALRLHPPPLQQGQDLGGATSSPVPLLASLPCYCGCGGISATELLIHLLALNKEIERNDLLREFISQKSAGVHIITQPLSIPAELPTQDLTKEELAASRICFCHDTELSKYECYSVDREVVERVMQV